MAGSMFSEKGLKKIGCGKVYVKLSYGGLNKVMNI
jgi:hypothetical protein